jgi:hypothetical protein
MEKITITEALSELQLIKKKAEKKAGTVLQNLTKPKHVPDQLEKEGGSREFLRREMQAISDLNDRYVRLKGAIAKANLSNLITINSKSMFIHDWLIWKRDIAQKEISQARTIYTDVKRQMDTHQRAPQVYKDDKDGTMKLLEIEPNVDYSDYLKKTEELEDTFEKLDGQLSLKNATIVVEI